MRFFLLFGCVLLALCAAAEAMELPGHHHQPGDHHEQAGLFHDYMLNDDDDAEVHRHQRAKNDEDESRYLPTLNDEDESRYLPTLNDEDESRYLPTLNDEDEDPCILGPCQL